MSNGSVPHPSLWKFTREVLAVARKEEGGKWLTKVRDMVLGVVASTIVAVLTGNSAGLVVGVITALLGLLLVGASQFALYFLAGAHKLHCNQLDQQSELRAEAAKELAEKLKISEERNAVVAELASPPLTLIDARNCLRWLADWLRKEAETEHLDISLHKTRATEVYRGLLRQPLKWDVVVFGTNDRPLARSRDFLQNRSDAIREVSYKIDVNDFDAKWKPPEWLLELGEKLDA